MFWIILIIFFRLSLNCFFNPCPSSPILFLTTNYTFRNFQRIPIQKFKKNSKDLSSFPEISTKTFKSTLLPYLFPRVLVYIALYLHRLLLSTSVAQVVSRLGNHCDTFAPCSFIHRQFPQMMKRLVRGGVH